MNKAVFLSCLLIPLLANASFALGEDVPAFPISGKLLTEFPVMEEEFTTTDETWHEDVRRLAEGLDEFQTPENYQQALDRTGMTQYLATKVPSTFATGNVWIQRGPIGGFGSSPRNGRIAGIQIIDPADSSPTIYVGASQGGLWKSQNSNASGGIWQDIGRNLPNPSVRGFAVDPGDSRHIIVGTGDHERNYGSGLYETYNEGDSWSKRATPTSPSYYYRVIFQNRQGSEPHQYVIAASSVGVFLSSDHGSTWALAHFADGSYVSGFWTDLLEHPTKPNIMYACVMGYPDPTTGGIYKSVDYGLTWSHLLDPSLPQDADWDRASLAICRTAPDVLAVLVESNGLIGGVFKTTDGGVNWSNITGTLGSFGGDQIKHAQAIAIRPTNPDQILVGSVSLSVTFDGGAHWVLGSSVGINIGHPDMTQIYFSDVISEDYIWFCNDGGIYYHKISNLTNYSYIGGPETGLACSEIDYMDADRETRVIGLQDNGVVSSFNHGQSWNLQSSGDGADVEIYDPVAGDYMYVVGVYPTEARQWRTYRKPADGPAVFLNNPYPIYMPAISNFTDNGLMATHNEKSVYVTNAETGTLWNQVATDLQTGDYFIRGLVTSQSGDGAYYVYYWSADPGDLTVVRYVEGQGWIKTHTEDITGTGQVITSVTPSREWPGEAWVTLKGTPGQSKIMHTTDYGVNWTDISNELDAVTAVESFEVQPFNPLVLFAGTNLGMFRSTDGGQSWLPFQNGLPIGRCRELHFVIDPFGAGHTLELAMDGRGMWTMPVAAPRILFVDGDSTAAEAGSREHPYHSVVTAMQNAPAGSILAVRSNTYNEPYVYPGDVVVMTWSGSSEIR